MIFLIPFLLSLIVVQSVTSDESEEPTEEYCKEILASGLYRPRFLQIAYNTNELYFTNKTIKMDENSRKPLKLNLKTGELVQIPGIEYAYTQTVINNGSEVFIGGEHGIYKYNSKDNITTFVGAKDKNIWKMFYKDVLYFEPYPEGKLYTFKDGFYTLFEDLEETTALHFVIDNEDTMFFTNDTGFYKQQRGSKDAVLIIRGKRFTILDLNFGPDGNLYACKLDGIYLVSKKTSELEKLIDGYQILGFAIDQYGNFIYSEWSNIYRLAPKKNGVC